MHISGSFQHIRKNIMKTLPTALLVAILGTLLGACAGMPEVQPTQLRPFADSPDPVVDTKVVDATKMASYYADLKECRMLQERSMPFNFLDEFGTNDVQSYKRAKEAKASAIMKNCLQGRGYAILY